MDMKQLDALAKVLLHGFAIIDVHELGRNQPNRQAVRRKPSVGEKQEVAVESRKTANVDTQLPGDFALQALLVFMGQMVMANIGRVRQNQIEPVGRRG